MNNRIQKMFYFFVLSSLLLPVLNVQAATQSRPVTEGYHFSILLFKSADALAGHICGLQDGGKGWAVSRVLTENNNSAATVYCINPITENEQFEGSYNWVRRCSSPGFGVVPYEAHFDRSISASCVSNSTAVIATKNVEPQSCSAGNPIHQGTGNKYQRERDFFGIGVFPLEFNRHYNSDSALANHDRATPAPLSPYWRHNYERRIISNVISSDPNAPTLPIPGPEGSETFIQVGSTPQGIKWWPEVSLPSNLTMQQGGEKVVYVLRPDGGQTYFVDTGTVGAPVWSADSDVTDTLTELTDAQGDLTGWQYINEDDKIETYDVAGRLITITSLEGHSQQLSYDINGRLSSVTGEQGESLIFTYDSEGRIATLTDHSSRVWGYRYDASNRLEYVDNPDGTTRQYHYEDTNFPNTNALTGITDERGIRYASWAYDSEGRAIMSTHADNAERVDIVYNADGTRTLTNSRGFVSTYTTMAQNGVQLIPNIIGPGCGSCSISDTHYEYDVNNNLIAKVDKGIRTEWGDYDARGNAGFMIEAAGTIDERRTDYTYDSRFRNKVTSVTVPSVITGQSRVTSYTYDAFGNRTSQQVTGYRPDGTPISRSTTYQYSGPLNQLSQIDGPRTDVQDITTLNYYADDPFAGNNRARLRQVISNSSDTEQIVLRENLQYSPTGQLLSEQRPNGLTLTYTYYPGNDRLETVTENNGVTSRTTRWTYLATGEVETITTGHGTLNATTLTLGYDDARRLTSVTDALGHSLSYTLDTEGNIIEQQNHDAFNVLRQTLTQTFDAYNRLESRIGAALQTTTFGYDANGNLDSRIDANNVTSSYTYDSLQRLTTVSNAPGNLSSYVYDVNDNLTHVTDPNGNTTNYQYDDLGNLQSLTSPDTGITTYAHYDGAGNAGQMSDANGNTTVYQYDALNRLTLATYQDGTTTQYSYDDVASNAVGRLSQIVDPSGTTRYQYNPFGDVTQLTQTIGSQTLITDYRYDTSGRLDQLIYPSGAIIDYAYTAGRISAININGAPLLGNIRYYPFGPAESWIWGNGTTTSRSFDLDGQMSQYSLNGDSQSLGYDPAGNLQTRSNALGTLTYGYDDLNRLTGVTGLQTQAFQYDANGNRTQLTDGADISSYTLAANSNRITNITGAQPKTYTYDANGNTLSDGTHSFTYNARNRMASANSAGYQHNGLGQRVLKQTSSGLYYGDASNDGLIDQSDFDQTLAAILQTATPAGNTDCNKDGTTNVIDLVCLNNLMATATPPQAIQNRTYFAYDQQGQLIGEYDNNGNPIQETVYLGNMPVATIKNGNVYYIHTDQLNTPRAISDANNITLWQWESTPFGETAANEDVDGDGEAFVYNLRFPGQYYDVETGLHYNYYRDYDPTIGRYITSDPIGLAGGLNTYGYAASNPTGFIDPFGLKNISQAMKDLMKLMGPKAADSLAKSSMESEIDNHVLQEIKSRREEVKKSLDLIDKAMRANDDRRVMCDLNCMNQRDSDPCFNFEACWEKCGRDWNNQFDQLYRDQVILRKILESI